MGAIGGLLGTGGGAAGTGFGGPGGSSRGIAPIVNPVNPQQITDSYNGVQNSFASQQSLLAALQAQNGLGNQNQVYGQLQGVVNGTGPNPAQAMLNQSTGQNVANQAALMAGQRGVGSNVGLAARQIGQQGAGIQQNAAGQAATLQANQSLNALGQAGNIANTQASNQIGQTNTNTQAQQAEQLQLLNAQAQANNANAGLQSNINSVNGQLAGTTMQGQQGLIGGLMNGIGGIAGLSKADGGDISAPMMADGGDASAFSGPQSKFGQFLTGGGAQVSAPTIAGAASLGPNAGAEAMANSMKGKRAPAAPAGPGLTGAGTTLPASSSVDFMSAASGGVAGNDYRSGGKVNAKNPKQKAVAPGNNYSNDKIPAVLSEHEIVLPRSVTLAPDPVAASAKFVANVIAKRKAGR